MKTHALHSTVRRAASLVETVIAIGVLAVAAPLVLATMTQAGKSGLSAEAETRSTWMIPTCMAEIRASRDGSSQYFTATSVGQVFPPTDEIWALAFSPEGDVIGKITKSQYDKGIREWDGKPVFYLASMEASTAHTQAGVPPMMDVRIFITYPAPAPVSKRQKLDFRTHIP